MYFWKKIVLSIFLKNFNILPNKMQIFCFVNEKVKKLIRPKYIQLTNWVSFNASHWHLSLNAFIFFHLTFCFLKNGQKPKNWIFQNFQKCSSMKRCIYEPAHYLHLQLVLLQRKHISVRPEHNWKKLAFPVSNIQRLEKCLFFDAFFVF